MYVLVKEEDLIRNKKTINLEGVVRIFFHNMGNSSCNVGLYKIPGGLMHTIETGGIPLDKQKVEITFENNTGELYMDIYRVKGCKPQ